MKILILLFTFVCSIALGQSHYYKPLKIGLEDGLPSETIRYVFKDSKGNMWYGTDVGIAMQNGKKIIQFSSRDGLAGDKVWAIDEDQQGNIWFGCYGSGLSMFDGKKFTTYKNEAHQALNSIRRIFIAQDGSVFAGSDIGLFRLKPNGEIKSFSKLLNNANEKMQAGGFFQFHKDTLLYVTIGKGECFYDLKNDTIFNIPKSHKYAKTRGYVAKEINHELVVAGHEIKIFKDDTTISEKLGNYGLNGPVWDVTYDNNGNYYMPAFGGGAIRNFGGVYKFDGEKFIDLSSHLNILGSNFWSILYDTDNDILHIGSLESGAYLLKNTAISYTNIMLSPKAETEVVIDANNYKWLCTSKNLIRINNKDTINYWEPIIKSTFERELNYLSYKIAVFNNPIADSIWCDKILSSYNYPFRNLYVHPGLGVQESGSLYNPDLVSSLRSKLNHPKNYFKNHFQQNFSIISVLPDDKGNVWISSSYGLFKVDNQGNLSSYFIPVGEIYIDKQNVLWNTPQYRSTKKIIDLSNPYQSIELSKSFKNSPKDVISHAETMNEVYFASWNSGMYVYKRDQDEFFNFSTSNSVLTSNSYKAVITITDSSVIGVQTNGSFMLFMSYNDSISINEIKPLSEYFKGKTISSITNIDSELFVLSSDGLYFIDIGSVGGNQVSSSFLNKEEGFDMEGVGYFCSTSHIEKENLFINSSNELIKLNLNKIKESIKKQKLQFYISNLFVNEESFPLASKANIKLQHYQNNIRIILKVENFINPGKDLFRFRIVGKSDNWSEWSDNNEIQLKSLNYGSYNIIFQHKNRIDSGSILSDELQLIILPPWFETTWFYSLIVLIFGGIIYFINWKRLKIIKKRQKVLESKIKNATIKIKLQRDQIAEKHRDIEDSINYAKRIQSAILPSIDFMRKKLKNSFIYYAPKDIVAGDFYWIEEQGDTTFFAACDCTGHGVPGAMVSVICRNGLNQAVREYGLSNPAKILDKTREIIISEFEKSEEEMKDGMDIALCALNGNELCYSGANNPLWVLRKGASSIDEIKGEKQPIGKYPNPKPFTNHKLRLNQGDTIYIFSDGFIDQFGGDQGKKFKKINFKNLLLSIQNETMDNQHKILDQKFEKWKGSLEQLDDVCVIGVKM